MQEQLADLTSKLELLELNMKKYTASIGQMTELQTQGAAKNKEEEEAYKVKKKTFDLLPNADENITKLKVSSIILSIENLNHQHPNSLTQLRTFINMQATIFSYC